MANTEVVRFALTTDATFQNNKKYYEQVSSVLGVYTTYKLATGYTVGDAVPENTYYELSVDDGGSYTYTFYPEQITTETDTAGNVVARIVTQEYVQVDNVTGVAVRNKNVERTDYTKVTNIVEREIERYSAASIVLGKVYRFVFLGHFARLGYPLSFELTADSHFVAGKKYYLKDEAGVYIPVPIEVGDPVTLDTYYEKKFPTGVDNFVKGVYRVDKMISYREAQLQGISLFENLYQPLNIDESVYNSDMNRMSSDTIIYKLVDPTNEEIVYYMPDIFIYDHPDTNVDRYCKVMLAFDLGVFANESEFDSIQEEVIGLLKARHGIASATEVFTYKDVYLTVDDYNTLASERDDVKTRASTPGDEYINLDTLLHLSEANVLKQENNQLRAKITAYEEIIANLHNNNNG